MFSPQLNEAKYNFLSADINKCGGKGNAIDVAFSRAKIQIYKIKFKVSGKMLKSTLDYLKKESRPLAGVYCTSMLLCYCTGVCCLLLCYCAMYRSLLFTIMLYAINYELECAETLNRVVVIIDGNTDFVALTL